MKNLILIAFVILTSVCFGQTDIKIYKKNGQVESVPIKQVDSVKYSTSSPTMMNVYKNNNTAILSVSIDDIDSVKYLTNGISVGSISGLNCENATTNGTLTANTIASAVSSLIPYSGGNSGTYTSQTISSAGVLGLTATLLAGTFANGNGTLIYTITGTPTTSGIASFEINIGGKTCVFSRNVELPVGSISALNCANAFNSGALTTNTVANGVSTVIPYTGGNGGTYSNQTIHSTGVLGLTALLVAGNFANGNGTLTYEISGTPTSNGTAIFEIIIGGKTCILTRDIALSVGLITNLECLSALKTGTLKNAETANSVSVKLSYTGGNGKSYIAQSITSTSISGLIAELTAGTFENGNGSVTYSISGTPASAGTASFAISLGGESCVINISVEDAEPSSSYGPDISDVDGNIYKSVFIGTQQWMAENLKTSKYNDGSIISNFTSVTQWTNLTTGAWAYYDNNSDNNSKYGKLYNWYALSITTNGNKNVCPTGWHVPTDNEWTALKVYLGGKAIAGGKMKEVGITSWNTPNTGAVNTSLFSALPGGTLNFTGFDLIGDEGYWWSSTEYGIGSAWYSGLFNDSRYVSGFNANKSFGFSVRCIKDSQ
jgi:uncharacterized protein (TIGR02145 family)